MEDTLGGGIKNGRAGCFSVLILVLMEDTLGENYEERTMSWGVLILVLMEDTLGV